MAAEKVLCAVWVGLQYQQLPRRRSLFSSPYKAQGTEPSSFCQLLHLSPPRSQQAAAVRRFEEVLCMSAAEEVTGSDAAVDELVLVPRREQRCCLFFREGSLFMEM